MRPTRIIDITCRQEAPCSAAVGRWNYWDHEHLTVLHGGHKDAQVLYETPDLVVMLLKPRLPIFSFVSFTTVQTMVQKDANTIVCYDVLFGIPSVTTITITEPRKDFSVYEMNYKFFLSGWRVLLAPLLRRVARIWNERVWQEDLPAKLRRQKVLRMNFKDFRGLPENSADREYSGPLDTELPVKRLPGSPVDELIAKEP